MTGTCLGCYLTIGLGFLLATAAHMSLSAWRNPLERQNVAEAWNRTPLWAGFLALAVVGVVTVAGWPMMLLGKHPLKRGAPTIEDFGERMKRGK